MLCNDLIMRVFGWTGIHGVHLPHEYAYYCTCISNQRVKYTSKTLWYSAQIDLNTTERLIEIVRNLTIYAYFWFAMIEGVLDCDLKNAVGKLQKHE